MSEEKKDNAVEKKPVAKKVESTPKTAPKKTKATEKVKKEEAPKDKAETKVKKKVVDKKAKKQTLPTAKASLKSIRTSPRKLNLVANLIRKRSVGDALTQLQFCQKRVAKDVKKLLESAIANAENNHGLDIDSLYITKVLVGKGMVMKRIQARARGRAYRIKKPFSNISIELTEMTGSMEEVA